MLSLNESDVRALSFVTESAVFTSATCPHHFRPSGYTPAARPRRRCAYCGKTEVISPRHLRMSVADRGILLMPYYRQGLTISETARLAKISRVPVRKAFKLLRSIHLVDCPCGLPSDHAGWCAVRYYSSPYRQAQRARRTK